MKKALVRLAILSSILVLSACGTPGHGFLNTNQPSDAGQAPTDYRPRIGTYLHAVLKDPESIRDVSVSEPYLASCSVGIYGAYNGWRVQVSYNAKNSYGAYVGLRTSYFWFHNENLKGVGDSPNFCPEAPAWR